MAIVTCQVDIRTARDGDAEDAAAAAAAADDDGKATKRITVYGCDRYRCLRR
jgi:hypothetical protein